MSAADALRVVLGEQRDDALDENARLQAEITASREQERLMLDAMRRAEDVLREFRERNTDIPLAIVRAERILQLWYDPDSESESEQDLPLVIRNGMDAMAAFRTRSQAPHASLRLVITAYIDHGDERVRDLMREFTALVADHADGLWPLSRSFDQAVANTFLELEDLLD